MLGTGVLVRTGNPRDIDQVGSIRLLAVVHFRSLSYMAVIRNVLERLLSSLMTMLRSHESKELCHSVIFALLRGFHAHGKRSVATWWLDHSSNLVEIHKTFDVYLQVLMRS